MNNFHYNKKLKAFAKHNRHNMTKSEVRLWKKVLRKRKVMGYQFRRQRPIGKYIVDFACLPLGLVIEVDGISHHDVKVFEKDEKRDAELLELGFFTLRFSSKDIFCDLDTVKANIEGWIEENASCLPSVRPKEKGG